MVVPLKLRGREAQARLPDLFANVSRSTDAASSVFLPSGYLTAKKTYEVGPAARGAAEGQDAEPHSADDDEVLVLELVDGGTLITSAQRLRETLRRTHPEAVAADGALLLERLRADGSAARGFLSDAVGGLIRRVFSLAVGEKPDDIVNDALEQFGVNELQLGVSWLGTKALMWAIENRLPRGPGLYRWSRSDALDPKPVTAIDFDAKFKANPKLLPMLVFVHGTASHTLGSFGDLTVGDRGVWASLERQFPGGIYGFEHRTLSQSPIDNACQLLEALPEGTHLSLVSHSRGGLVSDLLCLGDFASLIPTYQYEFEGIGSPDENETARVKNELAAGHHEHRLALAKLAELLAKKKPVVQRYVRVASPAGTKLASGNFDLFLSGILTLIGRVPFFFGSPVYAAFKRVVLEIAKRRTDPHLVPGIEAMLPDSPMARLLRDAPVREGLLMSVIAGDIEGGDMLKRLGVLLTDHLLFDNVDNDLVVDTPAMLAGIAPRAQARVKFDRGGDVTHFRYFANNDTRAAMRDWLVEDKPLEVSTFMELPRREGYELALRSATRKSRDAQSAKLPIVVLLPGIMGSHLAVRKPVTGDSPEDVDRVWFDPLDIASGGLAKIQWQDGREPVFADEVFGMFYGKLCDYLSQSHCVKRFPYDWRQPLDVLGERFGQFIDGLLAQTDQPIRLLAHSMGGLVVRACIHQRRSVMDQLMAREGARLVMLGTPNQGAYSMVENLLGKGDTLRTLVRLDQAHDMQYVLDIIAGFRGALQLLPKPGFEDQFQGQSDGGAGNWMFGQAATWAGFKPKVQDLWFGNGKVGQPSQDALDSASWLWKQDGTGSPALPAPYAKNAIYVFGVARNTPCGLREDGGRLKMVGTTRGDGTVSWQSGRIGGIGRFYYMPVEHGDLPATAEYFGAIGELLSSGSTVRLAATPPAVRAIEHAQPVTYDAGPPSLDDADAAQRKLLGGSLRNRVPPRPKRSLEVDVLAIDLRFLTVPLLVGHYEHDPIAGPQRLVDSELLNGDLSERHTLGLYPGPLGTAAAVLRVPNEIERLRGSVSGAVITGLGSYDKMLTPDALTEAVRAGALRYLLQIIDVFGKADRELSLAALLLGYNSSANLTVDSSVEALVRGVMEANARFNETTGLNIRIGRLRIVEMYLDTAISAVYALRYLGGKLASDAQRMSTRLVCHPELTRGEGVRQRLLDSTNGGYWPRLMVTDADRNSAEGSPNCRDVDSDCEEVVAVGDAAPSRSTSRTLLANRLRFLYVGQRARAESVIQHRQPGLIEQIVRRQIGTALWQEDFGRMLFQLMVPYDFKDTARQLDRIVLVVDSYTANLPWELLFAEDPARSDSDKRPFAVRTAVVRQLASTSFRRQVRQAVGPNALVIGNPSLDRFLEFFPGTKARPNTEPPMLGGAEAEATAIAGVLTHCGYCVQSVIGEDKSASDVLAALYRKSWRFLHISAHGAFDLCHVDGRKRSGVLLSDGVMITAAEIDAMEVVPELVFLNCCHLGKVDSVHVRDGNKLAASVARELIEIGVRCVVVAGWAVDDENACFFGEAFYDHLLRRNLPFGDAVYEARKAVWAKAPGDITWGAFQAYGDPSWRANPRAEARHGDDHPQFVTPDELLDALARQRSDLSRRAENLTDSNLREQVASIDTLLEKRCPPGWLTRPELQSALGATWRDLGEFERARDAFVAALQSEDKERGVPVQDVEQLANVEARLGERSDKEELIDRALLRLERLDELVDGTTPERCALRGSALKRKASLYARKLLTGQVSGEQSQVVQNKLHQALAASAAAYGQAEGSPAAGFSVYHVLNRLALQALIGIEAKDLAAAVDLARYAAKVAEQTLEQRIDDPWPAVLQAEAVLVECLLDGSLGASDAVGQPTAFAAIVRAYKEALAGVTLKPSQLDSLIVQVEMLSRFLDALAIEQSSLASGRRLCADHLLALVQQLRPGRPARTDRTPPNAPAEPGPSAGVMPAAPSQRMVAAVAGHTVPVAPAPRRPRSTRTQPAGSTKPKRRPKA